MFTLSIGGKLNRLIILLMNLIDNWTISILRCWPRLQDEHMQTTVFGSASLQMAQKGNQCFQTIKGSLLVNHHFTIGVRP